jgi:hypothetical protein
VNRRLTDLRAGDFRAAPVSGFSGAISAGRPLLMYVVQLATYVLECAAINNEKEHALKKRDRPWARSGHGFGRAAGMPGQTGPVSRWGHGVVIAPERTGACLNFPARIKLSRRHQAGNEG